MKVRFTALPATEADVDALVLGAFEGEHGLGDAPRQVDDRLDRAISGAISTGEFKAKANETLLLHSLGRLKTSKVLVVGLGKRAEAGQRAAAQAAGTAARLLRGGGVRRFATTLHRQLNSDAATAAGAVAGGACLALFDADTYRTEEREEGTIEEVLLLGEGDANRSAVDAELIVAESTNLVRDLVNRPANEMTPTILAEKAREIGAQGGMEVDVLDEEEMRRLSMGALLGVAAGSAEPAKLIAVRYEHPEASQEVTLAIIGKGITFDSGGISIKPAENMHKMKSDMAGGAAVLGAMRAISQLKPRLRVLGVVPATENLPGGRAYKPGDVLRTMNGKTIEILNTDAEGRVVLSDALTYAVRNGASHIVDLATLTGACVVALGKVTTGVMGRPDDWVQRVLRAASDAGEQMWQLPLFPEYREQIKSEIADIANTGGREAGSITGALFIGEFAEDRPWAHLDIAGTAWNERSLPYLAKGPTGVGVATLVRLIQEMADSAEAISGKL